MTNGICGCGCGQPTKIARRTRVERGQVAGQPLRYLLGHNSHTLPPLEQRFVDRYQVHESGCWIWIGTKTSDGAYPRFCTGKTTYVLAHRWAYEQWVGPIPAGLTIDHLCRTTLCVNYQHLEPVTAVENVMRGDGACARNAAKTHCVRGHEFTPDNTRVLIRGHRRARSCLACERIRSVA